ncbi:MAG TPA: radical SAM protein [Vicinamibacterales bacterium]|nr:radical SAM protein [Vicinamibacterales bacterium]
MNGPTLFPLAAAPRTTARDVARRVRTGGIGALSEARRRADQATYQEIQCRSALNKVEGMPFRWTLNPYRGCTHGCHYCFARRYHTQFEMNSGDEFSSIILVKTNVAEVLRQELDRPAWTREMVALGTATDPYQPIEGYYKLTRRALEALCDSRTPVGLVTKGPMALRDRDLFVEIGRRARCTVYFSVPTVDEEAWRRLEPGTAHPLQRLRAVRALVDAGVRTGVLMAPIVPGLTSQPARLERTVKAIADHGAQFVGAMVLHLEAGTRTHFLQFLAKEFPALVPRYERLYAGKYASKRYVTEVEGMVSLLQQRYGLHARRDERDVANDAAAKTAGGTDEAGGGPVQARFRFGGRHAG